MKSFDVDLDRVLDALNRAIISSFEEMAFIEVITDDRCSSELPQEGMSIVKILIVKPFTATLILQQPESLLEQIVENIYCKNINQIQRRDIADCSEELLNIITGNFLTNLLGKGVQFKFEFPEIIYSLPELEGDEKELIMGYNAEGHIFAVTFILGEV